MADIHLAEVAACHQVLTIVLGEPAEIEPALRDRIYQLPSQPKKQEPAPQATNAHLPPPIPTHPPQPSSVPIDSLDYKSRAKPTVPEYLREPRKKHRWFAISAGILSTVALLLIFLTVFHQLEAGTPIGNFFVRIGMISPKADVADANKSSKPKAQDASKKASSEPSATEPKNPPDNAVPANANPQNPPTDPNKVVRTPNGDGTQTPPGGETPAVAQPPQTTIQNPPTATENPGTPASTDNPTGLPIAPIDDANKDNPGKGIPGTEIATGSVNTPPNPGPIEPAPNAQNPIGRFTSTDQILLRSTGNLGNWERLPGGTILHPREHLLALPTYRTATTLSSGLILQMLGGTELELLPGDAQSPSGIKIRYGRMVINSVANPGLKLRIVIGNKTGTLTFADAESKVGIVVRRLHEPGVDPESESGRISTEIFVAKDRVNWEEEPVLPMEIVAPTRIMMWPDIPPVTDHPKDFPAWISAAELIKEIDRRASQNMQPAFTVEQPAQQKLLELADPTQTRLQEVRWLATRSLGYLDYFDTMVGVLNDPKYKDQWFDNYIEWLREAVARDPQTASAVREALEKLYGPQAANLYRMLWGYTNKDLIAGADAVLVKNLDDDSLAVRVLAIWNLKDITGRDIGFKPEATLAKRLPMYQRWKQRLDAKEIRFKSTEKKGGPTVPEAPNSAEDENFR
jgi:hypothetical protein